MTKQEKGFEKDILKGLDMEIFQSKIQIAWYKDEVKNHKYNSVASAKEGLEVRLKVLESLLKRKKQQLEMFEIYSKS